MNTRRYTWILAGSLLLLVPFAFAAYDGLAAPGEEDGADLLGLGPDEVISRLGVPSRVIVDHSGATFTYDGKPAVRFHDKTAYWVDPEFKGVSERNDVPPTGAYSGMSVKKLVERMGSPAKVSVGQVALELTYADGTRIILSNGITVVGGRGSR